jgi:undecaprenyl-diphosphatase
LFWGLAVVVPIFVAMSRLYRGMHHPTDVLGSVSGSQRRGRSWSRG